MTRATFGVFPHFTQVSTEYDDAASVPTCSEGEGIRVPFRSVSWQVAVRQVLERAQVRVRALFEEITLADLAAAGLSAPAENRS